MDRLRSCSSFGFLSGFGFRISDFEKVGLSQQALAHLLPCLSQFEMPALWLPGMVNLCFRVRDLLIKSRQFRAPLLLRFRGLGPGREVVELHASPSREKLIVFFHHQIQYFLGLFRNRASL